LAGQAADTEVQVDRNVAIGMDSRRGFHLQADVEEFSPASLAELMITVA
jgi:hypothetical protein